VLVDAERVTARAVEVVRGADNRLYPARLLPPGELARRRRLVHALRCRDQLSLREVVRVLAEQYGIRRSMGSICNDLRDYRCPYCPEPAPDPAPAPQEQPAAAVHSRPGGLTGMLAGDG
jgi:hypothetical protein